MKKILLASVGIIISTGTTYAACIPTPSCASLGYESSSSCEGGIKCPFGNAWNCTLVNKITEIEKIIQEGSGNKGDTSNCVVGSIFYSDWTCSYGSVIATKAPIGVVVYSDNAGHGQVMALKSIGGYMWAKNNIDIPDLKNYTSESEASQDFSSCDNTNKIIMSGNSSEYPAAWAAHEYKTVGTEAGDWCLPAAGIIVNIKNNRDLIDIGYNLVNGDIIVDKYYWTSTEYDASQAWFSHLGLDSGIVYTYGGHKKDSTDILNVVRPVLEF